MRYLHSKHALAPISWMFVHSILQIFCKLQISVIYIIKNQDRLKDNSKSFKDYLKYKARSRLLESWNGRSKLFEDHAKIIWKSKLRVKIIWISLEIFWRFWRILHFILLYFFLINIYQILLKYIWIYILCIYLNKNWRKKERKNGQI